MLIVLDTNVLVSGLLNPFGIPGSILSLIIDEKIIPCYDARILIEYEEVLGRPKFKFNPEHVAVLISNIRENGQLFVPGEKVAKVSDPDDQPFAQVAKSAHAVYLITGNASHFPRHIGTTAVVSPAVFINQFYQIAP